jgi:hypothetical protein
LSYILAIVISVPICYICIVSISLLIKEAFRSFLKLAPFDVAFVRLGIFFNELFRIFVFYLYNFVLLMLMFSATWMWTTSGSSNQNGSATSARWSGCKYRVLYTMGEIAD